MAYVEHTEGEVLVNSGEFDGLPAPEGGRRIVERLAAEGRGRFTINYRLRDWGFSRQRYWGCPIPVVYCDACGIVPVPGGRAARRAPRGRGLQAEGRSAARAGRGVGERAVPALRRAGEARDRDDGHLRRLVLVLPALLRRRRTTRAPFERAAVDYWNPVDLYIGGVDHATMHMIYARFWVKVLNDLGMLGFREPFAQFFSNGWVTLGKVKMSKRAGNIVGPDDFVERYGADACRLNILFLGPPDQDMEWTEASVEAMARFVRRLWSVVNEVVEKAPMGDPEDGALARKAHATIAKVTDDIGRRFAFNTGIAAVMELVNELSRDRGGRDARFAAETAVSLDPAVRAARRGGAVVAARPRAAVGGAMARRGSGAARGRDRRGRRSGEREDPRPPARVARDSGEDELVALARASERVVQHLNGGEPARTVVVPGKLVNFVT